MIFEFDGFNRMTGMETGGTVAEYEYNSDGLRVSKTVNDERTDFVLDGINVIAEIDFDGNVTNYVRGLTGIIYRKAPDGTKTYYVTNNHGDVTKLVNSSGTVIQTYTYDEYGNVTSSTGNDPNPFLYCGEYYDWESGLIYLRARYYSPELGRFISEDPARDELNWYVYCGSNPVNFWDYSGKTKTDDEYFGLDDFFENIDEIQKEIQRAIWKLGAQEYLREGKGYLTSAWMLEHSLQDNPDDVYRGNDSRVAYLINNDSVYLNALDRAIESSKNGVIDTTLDDIIFENGDLYYSIHKADISVSGYRQQDGSWIIKATMTDSYDFTEIQTIMSDDGNFSKEIGLGTIANDVAAVSQMFGAISPYDITVEFYTTRRVS